MIYDCLYSWDIVLFAIMTNTISILTGIYCGHNGTFGIWLISMIILIIGTALWALDLERRYT